MSFLGGRGKSKESSTPSARAAGGRVGGQSPIESVIGPNTYIKGEVQGDGGLRIDGVVEGKIELTGNLVITESAKVQAEIKASNVSIAGAVQGNISANRVEILDTGRVWGDLTIKSLLINEGAYLRGQTFMPQDLQPPQLEAPQPLEETSIPKPKTSASSESQAEAVVDVEPEPSPAS